jgi:hypothetical protein
MGKAIGGSWLAILLTALTGQPAPIVRDHRETPGGAAQWTADGEVSSLTFHRLFNTERRRHLATSSSGGLVWEETRPGAGRAFFENCTRPGERIYSSDRVAIRFGSAFVKHASGSAAVTASSQRECEFRLVPGVRGLVPAGSGDRRFAIYSIPANRYLVYRPLPALLGVPAALTLRWQATASGRPPGNVAARADFVAEDLFFTASSAGDTTPTLYLTIKNIGNVRSSASQREMKIRVRGQEKDFVVLQPVAPGATLRNPLRFDGALGHCEEVLVELDTRTGLKFQVGEGAFPNADVFANDRSAMRARDTRAAEHSRGRAISVNCDPGRIVR